ncbi:MAG: hypothetical protein Q6373_016990 [Candidatus Sigynarchaeota archaeon]
MPGNQNAAFRAGHLVPTDRAPVLAGTCARDLPPIHARSTRTGFRGFDLPLRGGVVFSTRFARRGWLPRGWTRRELARARGRIDRRGLSIAAIDQGLEPALVRGIPIHAGMGGSARAGDRRGIDPRVGKIAVVEMCREPARPRVGARLATLSMDNLSADGMRIDHAGARIAGGS